LKTEKEMKWEEREGNRVLWWGVKIKNRSWSRLFLEVVNSKR